MPTFLAHTVRSARPIITPERAQYSVHKQRLAMAMAPARCLARASATQGLRAPPATSALPPTSTTRCASRV